jgi:pyruvate dehydrogenase E2 component (dihydrolipoamide acetyltransferase)
MASAVIMPRQGQSVETCILGEWTKKKGDSVKTGDVLCSYETDKASFEIAAETDGTLLEVFFQAGDEVPVLINIAVIGKVGEKVDEFRPGNAKPAAAETKQAEKTAAKSEIVSQPASKTSTTAPQSEEDIKISPRARKTAGELGIAYNTLAGSGPEGRIIERDVLAASSSQPRMTPLAQQLADETGKVPSSGSGIGGRALHSDLGTAATTVSGNDFEDKKLSNVRKIIAKTMYDSLRNSAQLTHHLSADVRKLLAFRNECKKAVEKGNADANITLNDMISLCVIKALKKMPEANAHFLNDTQRFFNKVHLGLAVDTPRGLMVPVIRNADSLSLKQLSAQIKAIAESCRKGNIDPALLQSNAASFTISNLGNYGVEMFTPVINLPQVAILGVNTIITRPADLGGGVFGFVPYIGLSLTYDHRAIDGGPATLFLKEIKMEIENWNEKI